VFHTCTSDEERRVNMPQHRLVVEVTQEEQEFLEQIVTLEQQRQGETGPTSVKNYLERGLSWYIENHIEYFLKGDL